MNECECTKCGARYSHEALRAAGRSIPTVRTKDLILGPDSDTEAFAPPMEVESYKDFLDGDSI